MATSKGDPRRTYRWQITRRRLLADNPVCVWCGLRTATEADHLIPIGQCEDPYDPANLVPACKSCNVARGNRARAGKRRPPRGRPAMGRSEY